MCGKYLIQCLYMLLYFVTFVYMLANIHSPHVYMSLPRSRSGILAKSLCLKAVAYVCTTMHLACVYIYTYIYICYDM